MWNSKQSAMLSIVVCWVCVAILTAFLIAGPWLIGLWFIGYYGWGVEDELYQRALQLYYVSFYPCAAFGYVTLYSLIRLLTNIRRGDVFTLRNVAYLRRISWCCFAVAAIALTVAILYVDIVPFLLVAGAAAFVGLMLRVVKNVMQQAVEIREENELTI